MTSYNYCSEIAVSFRNETSKATLALGPSGDVQLVTGKDKLLTQLIRKFITDYFSMSAANTPIVSDRAIRSWAVSVLRAFKDNQTKYINRTAQNLIGYYLFRREYGTVDNFVRVNAHPTIWRYSDTGVLNGTSYEYKIKKVFKKNVLSDYVASVVVTPSSVSSQWEFITSNYFIVENGNEANTFYFFSPQYFYGSEILSKVIGITTEQNSEEPRKVDINITLEDYDGNNVGLATRGIALNIG